MYIIITSAKTDYNLNPVKSYMNYISERCDISFLRTNDSFTGLCFHKDYTSLVNGLFKLFLNGECTLKARNILILLGSKAPLPI